MDFDDTITVLGGHTMSNSSLPHGNAFIPPASLFTASFLVDFINMTATFIAVYFSFTTVLYFLLFHGKASEWMGAKKIQPRKPHNFHYFKEEVVWSTSTITVGSFFLTILYHYHEAGQTALYWSISDYGWTWYIFSASMMWIFNDFYMYWMHVFMHTKQGSWIHELHHWFTAPTPFSTMAFHPAEAVAQFWPLFVTIAFPIHAPTLFFISTAIFMVSVIEHTGYDIPGYERAFKYLIATPVHHDIHHSRVKHNYGVYMVVWDYIMGTRKKWW